ncbi:hypothetical protein ACFWWM_43905 [Streptomyces sp. NPDC058682]|uniref:hypothetical protein n=1 Tax=unclassified Streptomyces TaxID=2593676 RepID=UPI002253B34C|nr:hypothetical protein [Streptomyces sp. NBC_01214]MCX4803707.1 hypothetical protein [Streptomyces sp. NBC_01214]
MTVPKALATDDDESEVVTDFATGYFARRDQEQRHREREASYLAQQEEPEHGPRKVAPIGYLIPEPPPPPPPPQPRPQAYQRLIQPR